MLSPTSNLPPFPEGLSLAPIAVVSSQKLLDGDGNEATRVLAATQGHGFFYLDLQGTSPGETLLAEAEQLHALAKAVFSVPLPEKRQYDLERGVSLFGYKPAGAVKTTDRDHRLDTTEFFCIAKDHLHHVTPSRPYPPEIESHRPLLRSFTHHGHACGMLVLSSLASQLGLQPDAFAGLNLFDQPSGDHCRLTHKPPDRNVSSDGGTTNNTIGLASHTDFGSVTVLFNWLGGLQIESSSSQTGGQREWQWVKPLPGHAIVNLGRSCAYCIPLHPLFPLPLKNCDSLVIKPHPSPNYTNHQHAPRALPLSHKAMQW